MFRGCVEDLDLGTRKRTATTGTWKLPQTLREGRCVATPSGKTAWPHNTDESAGHLCRRVACAAQQVCYRGLPEHGSRRAPPESRSIREYILREGDNIYGSQQSKCKHIFFRIL